MPRLLGVDIPNDRPTVVALTYLYGVGPKIASELCLKAGVDPTARAKELKEDEIARLAALLDNVGKTRLLALVLLAFAEAPLKQADLF